MSANAKKALDRAHAENARLTSELDSTYAYIRAVAENCKDSPARTIRAQLVGLLPEVREMEPGVAARMREKGMGHLVDRHEAAAQTNWSKYGYPAGPTDKENQDG